MTSKEKNTSPAIYIVDDDRSVLESLQFLLESYDYKVIAFASGVDFLAHADVAHAGCVILDSDMPELTGQQVHRRLSEGQSPLSIIYLTGKGNVPMAVDALKRGAVDFLQKPVEADVLLSAIKNALTASRLAYEKLADYRLFMTLTEREKDLFHLLKEGYKNQEIADTLAISLRTVEVHRANVMKKLQAKTAAEVVNRFAEFPL